MTPIPGSVRSLDLGDTTPPSFRSSSAQVGITGDGAQLLVSTKSQGVVDAFALGPDGRPASAAVTTPTGPFPFAFAFDARRRLVLADAGGSATTYRVLPSGALSPTGTSAANGQQATCRLGEARGYFYATNTAGDTITGYSEAPDGQLQPLHADGINSRPAVRDAVHRSFTRPRGAGEQTAARARAALADVETASAG